MNPYLTFNDNCREAMNYYKECLGGELSLTVVRDSPAANQVPPHMKDLILHSLLKTDNLEIMATGMQPETLQEGNEVHLCPNCKTEQEMIYLWDKLSAG